MNASNQKILVVFTISKCFDITQSLNKVSIQMNVGERYALVGENGADKTTLKIIFTGIQKADQ